MARRLKDLPDIVEGFIYKSTNKRLERIRIALDNNLYKRANQLFRMVVVNNMNVNGPSAELIPYMDRGWRRLSKSWTEAKGHSNFWYGYTDESFRTNEHLKDYLAKLDASSIFGLPQVKIARNLKARGYQMMTFNINPYPRRGSELRAHMDSEQYDKLFGARRDGKMSNEQDRPLISPAINCMINNHLRRFIKMLIRRATQTGEVNINEK